MRRFTAEGLVALLLLGTAAAGILVARHALGTPDAVTEDDWPTYNHDAARSAVSVGHLDAPRLRLQWTYRSRMPVRPAWPGPEQRDYYNSPDVDNEDRLDFDSVYHVAAVGDSVYFGSSGEDSLRCLDARTGEPRWTFTTDGPVRWAPHVVGERVYFGSDDGRVYCVGAVGGEEVWERRLAPSDYQVPSDGKLISLWPNRSGVVVLEGRVYCAAGIFPSEGVYVCALDADTGVSVGTGLYCDRYADMSPQGYVLASDSYVYFPGGRAPPWVFDRRTGKRQGQLDGGGGTYALVIGDGSLIYGPGRNSAVLEEYPAGGGDRLAAFPGAKHIVVTPEQTVISTRDSVMALDRARYLAAGTALGEARARRGQAAEGSPEAAELDQQIAALEAERQRSVRWTVEGQFGEALILAGDYVVAGGRGTVAAFRARDGRQEWSYAVAGAAKGLAAARGRLYVSTDEERRIYCFAAP